MIEIIKTHQRDLQWLDVAGATVRVADPIIGKGDNLAAGFTVVHRTQQTAVDLHLR